jgi:hypothetical protein
MSAVEKVSSSFLRRRTAGMSEKLSYLAVTMIVVKFAPRKQTKKIWVGLATPRHGDADVGPVPVLQGGLLQRERDVAAVLEGALHFRLLRALEVDRVLANQNVLSIDGRVACGRRVEDDNTGSPFRRRDGQLVPKGNVAKKQRPADHDARVGSTGAHKGVGEPVQCHLVHRRHEDVPGP